VLCEEIAANLKFWPETARPGDRLIDNAHKRNPERLGLDLSKLRAALGDQFESVFEALIAELCADDFVSQGSAIARTSHRPVLPAGLEPIERRIAKSLSHKPFDPLPRRESTGSTRAVCSPLFD